MTTTSTTAVVDVVRAGLEDASPMALAGRVVGQLIGSLWSWFGFVAPIAVVVAVVVAVVYVVWLRLANPGVDL